MQRSLNIGLLLTGEYSCYNAAFGLAQALRERGHNVMFLVNKGGAFADYVVNNGFETVPVVPVAEPHAGERQRTSRLRFWKRLSEHSPNVLLKQQRLCNLIEENSIDLCFIDDVRGDVNLCVAALARDRIPTILLSYTFSSPFSTDYPPVFSALIPPRGVRPHLGWRMVYTLLWGWTVSTKGRTGSYHFSTYVRQSVQKLLDQFREMGFERELRLFGWGSAWSEWKRRPLVPQVVFEHRMIDWSAVASNPQRYYFGTCDLWRAKSVFDWSKLDMNKPIVYCSISTSGEFGSGKASISKDPMQPGANPTRRSRMAQRYLEVVIECFSRRPDWQLLVACGALRQGLAGRAFPPNIHLFEWLPQLAILEEADLAITWGGAGTIRECINKGVPMLIFPAWTDQFGNAARVVAHKAGLRGSIHAVSAQKLTELVDQVLTGELINSSVREMRTKCSMEDDLSGLIEFVERYTGLQL